LGDKGGVGPGGMFTPTELGFMVVPYLLSATKSIIANASAKFYHAGRAVVLSTTDLPSDVYKCVCVVRACRSVSACYPVCVSCMRARAPSPPSDTSWILDDVK
jgi:hypothetical protein